MIVVTFDLYPLRLVFAARDPVYFPPGKSANTLRGAFGLLFRKLACVPSCLDARGCERRAHCSYARVFEPAAVLAEPSRIAPSGLANWPRPFVFRAAHLDGKTIAAGERFHFDVHLFDTSESVVRAFFFAFAHLGRNGLGPRRGRADLVGVRQLGETGDEPLTVREPSAPLRLELEPLARGVSRIRVRFLTPTGIKAGNELAARPEFGVLFARVRDRVGTLRALYGAGPLDIDFKGMGERAARVPMTRCELSTVEVQRRSSRTGQVHGIGGFLGFAEYAGGLDEFLPYLKAARWTGVGRQTVWGKGEIAVEEL